MHPTKTKSLERPQHKSFQLTLDVRLSDGEAVDGALREEGARRPRGGDAQGEGDGVFGRLLSLEGHLQQSLGKLDRMGEEGGRKNGFVWVG